MGLNPTISLLKSSIGVGRVDSEPEDGKTSPKPMFASMVSSAAKPLTTAVTAKPTKFPGVTPGKLELASKFTIPSKAEIPFSPIKPSLGIWPPQFFLPQTTTQLSRGAIKHFETINGAVIEEAISTLRPKKISANGLINYLERKVKIGEILNKPAKNWDKETLQDFAAAFQMEQSKLDVMDAIKSIAILNDPDLEEELLIENTPEVTGDDLLENRRIVWQYPEPGTPIDPPYLVLVAVEHRDVREAENVVKSIIGELVNYQKFKIPKNAAEKLKK